MQLKIEYRQEYDKALLYSLDKLPGDLCDELLTFLNKNNIYTVNEIRIKAYSYISLIINQKNIITDILVNRDTLDKVVLSLCDGSIYAHLHTMRDGYISVGKGIRAGICGKAAVSNGQIDGIYDISSINLRIPQRINHAADPIFNYLKERSFFCSAILYSPPGAGKTTILRDLTSQLSREQVRCAVIDTREEITPFLDENLTADVFLAYPKDTAIDMATKSMTPQIIICDEITSIKETEAIKYTVNSGVSFIATTHASTFEEFKSKEVLKPLLMCNTFDVAIGIRRNFNNKLEFSFNELS